MKSLLKLSFLISVVVCFLYILYYSNNRSFEDSDSVVNGLVSYKSSFDGSKLDVVNSVKYKNLVPNKEYTVDCGVYIRQFDSQTGLYEDIPAVSSDGTYIKGSTTFVADNADGVVDVALKGDVTEIATGKSIVIYEKIR